MAELPTKRGGFRFGLRTIFVVATLLGVIFGYLAMRANWLSETARRHNAMAAKLRENLFKPPAGVAYDWPETLKKHVGRYFLQSWDERRRFFDLGNEARHSMTASTTLGFNIAKPPTGKHPADLCQRLLEHYEIGLETVGLARSIGGYSGQRCQTLWTDEGVVVIVEVWVNSDQTSGGVQMLVVDEQEFHLW
jgi:hypothetical protein